MCKNIEALKNSKNKIQQFKLNEKQSNGYTGRQHQGIPVVRVDDELGSRHRVEIWILGIRFVSHVQNLSLLSQKIGKNVPEDTFSIISGEMHSSLIIGRRFNQNSGSCEYLIRNYWGRPGRQRYHKSIEIEDLKSSMSTLIEELYIINSTLQNPVW